MSSRAAAILATASLAVCTGTMAEGPSEPADVARMLERADAPRAAFAEGVVGVHVVVSERGKKPSEGRMDLYLEGTDRSLIVMREGKQKGRKILTVGDRVWLIVPGASRPVPVSKSQRLMGAASFGDIARLRFAEEYGGTLRADEETLPGPGGATRCHVLDLVAKRKGTGYPVAVLWVGADDGLARRLRLSLASGKEARDVTFTRYDARHRVAEMEIRDLIAAGGANVTHLTFESYEPRTLDPALFTPEGAKAEP